ncbi:hypothetical protein BHE74_00004877 [Ensete ventricosum]|nr:hypothetical protein GW17_00007086 [Ensete ventricosum]RWW86349.1 hypothetical protein BHE74_00004877 [Ensete ventricosum]RZR81819.1 hypothetical protein BHM03_00008121 [Ensete ventricosum]
MARADDPCTSARWRWGSQEEVKQRQGGEGTRDQARGSDPVLSKNKVSKRPRPERIKALANTKLSEIQLKRDRLRRQRGSSRKRDPEPRQRIGEVWRTGRKKRRGCVCLYRREKEGERGCTDGNREEREREVPPDGGLPVAARLTDGERRADRGAGRVTRVFWLRRRGRVGLLGGST